MLYLIKVGISTADQTNRLDFPNKSSSVQGNAAQKWMIIVVLKFYN